MKQPFGRFILIVVMVFFSFSPLHSSFAASNLEGGITELAQTISKNMSDTKRRKIAIIEFSDLDGKVTAFGQFLAEELITKLFMVSPGQFEVVERRQIMKVLSEQKLSISGLLDASAMKNVGKILGIDAIVTGSYTDLGNDVKVNARLIGVDTAKVFAVAATKIPKVGTVANLLARSAGANQPFASSGGYSGMSSTSSTSPGNLSQEFKNIHIEVTSLRIMKNNDIVIFIRYLNKSTNKATKELKVALSIGNVNDLSEYPTYMMDNNGNEYRLKEMGGMGSVGGSSTGYNKGEPVTLSPGSQVTVSFKFRGADVQQAGSLFTFTSAQAIILGRRRGVYGKTPVSSFNVSFQDIRPLK